MTAAGETWDKLANCATALCRTIYSDCGPAHPDRLMGRVAAPWPGLALGQV